ncbi:MAG: Zn-dependent hydrolase [Oscillospiraceae bacterium]|nr:Zn-dependent hydrolase [Oscillospiraceae bacterium]
MFTCDKNRVEETIKAFSQFGATEGGGVTRFALSKECIAARDYFVKRMKAAGCVIETDDFANVYATLPGSQPGLPRIVTGSHCDSVKNGGNYDGILGVIGAMEVIEAIVDQNIPHRHPITAMIWTNEEGAVYIPALMGSGVVCGKFDKNTVLASVGANGQTFAEALDTSGYKGEEKNRLTSGSYKANFELHIEQGPILEAKSKDIGVVTCVLGMVNYRIKLFGQSNHAGATPMKFRQDALYAAAQAIVYLHEQLDRLDPALVYTTGEITCRPCIHSVIPNYVDFSFDARHENPKVTAQVLEIIQDMPKKFAKCRVEVQENFSRETVYFDKNLVATVQKCADTFGYSNMQINSGPGHDAQYTAGVLPTTMIFIPSKGGHSHREEEFTSLDQCWQGINVLLGAILETDKK